MPPRQYFANQARMTTGDKAGIGSVEEWVSGGVAQWSPCSLFGIVFAIRRKQIQYFRVL